MESVRYASRMVVRFVVVWLVDLFSLLLMASVVPGIELQHYNLIYAGAAALMLGVVNLVVRPVILLLSLPFGFIAVFVVGLLVNSITLMITSWLLPFFQVENWLSALVGGVVFAVVNAIVTNIIELNDGDSFYQAWVERLARREPFAGTDADGLGLVMLEIDGLSYWHIAKAIENGYMPTVRRMLARQGYQLSRIDCGLPSQTSACQSGIMFGDNDDIPAFRWYDKETNRLYVSGHDAAIINARYARGEGLMRGGSSINNMMAGDAQKSLLTLATLMSGDEEENRRRTDDIYLLMLNPYFFMRTLVLFFGDVFLELWEAWQQHRHDIQPRLNRLNHFYPFVRAATTVLMREVAAYLAILDIIRGSPSIYVTWPGYDEVAHHSGPWTKDAFRTLRQFDTVIGRIGDVISHKAPRPYELVILSDHGQSFGATFRQRYGLDLKQFIEQFLPQGTKVAQTTGGDDGALSVGALGKELGNVKEQKVGGRMGRAVAGRGQKLVERSIRHREVQQLAADTQVTVCGSGNLAQVYFDLYPRKITLEELDIAYPGMVDALVSHEGIGFVVGYDEEGAPVVLGKEGTHNLATGAIEGVDPLASFARDGIATVELRAEQVRRLAGFTHSGDLIVNSTLFADGTVAAMEELVGSHGGLGGEQTDAFILHPSGMAVPPTKNSVDVYHILNARRGMALAPPEHKAVEVPAVNAWSPTVLLEGLADLRTWLSRAFRALILETKAYKEIVADAYMTGPALLIMLVAAALSSWVAVGWFNWAAMAWQLGASLLGVLLMFAAGRLLGGKGSFTATLRGAGFGRIAVLFDLLNLVPVLSGLGPLLGMVLTFAGTWMGAAAAHRLQGWRSLVLPLVGGVVAIGGVLVLGLLFFGGALSVDALIQSFDRMQLR